MKLKKNRKRMSKSSSESEKEEKADEEFRKLMKEIEKSSKSEKEQSAKGLIIMSPNQLLTRLPIILAQKKSDNNSQILNNEIRQIIYSL